MYEKEYLQQIKQATSDKDIENIINRIYDDGFQDGQNNPITPESFGIIRINKHK